MRIKDLRYPEREVYRYGTFYKFHNYEADLPDKIAIELIQTGDYQAIGAGSLDAIQLPFDHGKWRNERKLVLDTAIGFENGYGKAGIYLAEGLADHTDLYVLNNGFISSNRNNLSSEMQSLLDKPLDVADSYYVQFWPAFNFRPLARRQIGYTMLEATRIPKSWVENIHNSCERVIVPCKAQKQAFIDSGVKCDIAVIPLGLDASIYPYKRRKAQEEYIFGVEGTLTYRKGVDVTVKAFQLAFPEDKYPNVRLIIKTRPMKGIPFAENISLEGGRILLNGDKRIEVIAENWSHETLINEFYNFIDCYVFLSRGEGWGMTTMQAMATGLPVIGSDCSGVQDHLNNMIGYLVETDIVDVPNNWVWNNGNPRKANHVGEFGQIGYPQELQAEGQQWWEPKLDHAVETMREVYNNQQDAIDKGKNAAKFVRKTLDNKITAKTLVDYLDSKL